MGKLDLTGQRFGKAVVIKEIEPYIQPSGNKKIQWECQCDCGNIFNATTHDKEDINNEKVF